MHEFHKLGRKSAFAAFGVIAALGAGGTAYAATSTGSTGPTAPAATSTGGAGPAANPQSHPGKRHLTLLQRTDHATAEVKVRGQWVTYTLDRGKVSAASSTSITLALPDGQNVTDAISATTKFGGVSSESSIRIGQMARVVSLNGAAVRIRQGRPSSVPAPTPSPAPNAPSPAS